MTTSAHDLGNLHDSDDDLQEKEKEVETY